MKQILTQIIFFLVTIITINTSFPCYVKQSVSAIPLFGNSSEYLFLSNIFGGHDLTYQIKEQPDCMKITPPVQLISSSTISDSITSSNYVLRIRQDWNGVWKSQAALTSYQNLKYYVNFGTKNYDKNFVFNSSKMIIQFQNSTNCFGNSYIDNFLALGCHQSNTQLLKIVFITEEYLKVFSYQVKQNVTNIKILNYLSSQFINYLLVAVSTNEDDFIYVLKYNKTDTNITLNIEKIINKNVFKLDSLKIFDIAVDSFGNIYVTDFHNIFRIKYLFSKIVNLESLKLQKADKVITLKMKNKQVIFVSVDNEIILFSEQLNQIKSFKLPLNQSIVSLKANQEYLVVVTYFNRYIYSIETTEIIQVKKLSQQKVSFTYVQQASNLLLQVNQGKISLLFTLSKGIVSIVKPEKNITVNLIANSKNQTNLTCQVTFDIITYDNPQNAVKIKDFQPITHLESPVKMTIKMDDYIVGPEISYFGSPQDSDFYNYQSREKTNQIPYPQINQTKYLSPTQSTTLTLDDKTYLRLICQNKTIIVQKCSVQGKFVQVNPFYSLETEFPIKFCDISFVKQENKLVPTLGYILIGKPSKIITIVLQTNKIQQFQMNLPGQRLMIKYFKLTELFVVAMFVDYNTISFLSFENSVRFDLNKQYFIDNKITQVQQFYPNNIHFSKQQDVFYITNTNLVLVFSLSQQEITYLTFIQIQDQSTIYKLNVMASNSHLLVIVSSNLDKILKYKIQSRRKYLLLGQIYFQGQGRNLQTTQFKSTQNFAFIKSINEDLITLRINSPFSSTYYNISKQSINSKIWFTGTQVGNFTIIDIKNSKQEETVTSFRYQNFPTLTITTNNSQNELKKQYPVKIVVLASNIGATLQTKLYVYNYQIYINPKQQKYQKLYLQQSIPNGQQKIVDIDINSFFIGSVIDYTISCHYCENSIQLRGPFTFNKTILSNKSLDYINIRDNLLWVINDNQQISYSLNDGHTFITKTIKANGIKFIPIDNNQAFIFCPDSNPAPRFVTIVVKQGGQPQQSYGFTISQRLLINNIQKSKLVEDYLYVFGDNKISVFKLTRNSDKSINSTVGETILTNINFELSQSSIINDFEVFLEENSGIQVIVCTTGSGIVYGYFNYKINSSLLNPKFLNLNNDSKIQDLVMNSNEYLQINHLYFNTKQIQHTFLLTSSYGVHFQISLIFSTQLIINQFKVINHFSKYGSQIVQKKAMFLPHSQQGQNLFIIPHLNQTNNLVTFSLYKYTKQSIEQMTNIKGGIKIQDQDIDSMYFFRSNGFIKFIYSKTLPTKEQNMNIYNVSQSLQLRLNYSQGGKFNYIQLTGQNIYSKNVIKIPVKFGNALQWYTILIIVIASLIVIGLIVFIVIKFIRYKRNKNNESRIINSQNITSLMSDKNMQQQ